MIDNMDLKNKKLEALQKMFADKIPETILSILADWKNLKSKLPEKVDAEDFHRKVHSLAGTAGSFGFEKLGKKAKEIELAIMDLCKEPENKLLLKKLEKLIVQLQQASLLTQNKKLSIQFVKKPKKQNKAVKYFVYLLEDDSFLAEQACKQLTHFGYEVKHFFTGNELIAAVKLKIPDILVVDIHLPEDDNSGPETVKIIRQQKSAINIPVIFISSVDTWNVRLDAVKAGGQAYLVKPVNFHELVEQLDFFTGKKKMQKYRILIVDDTQLVAEHYATILEMADMEVKVINKPHGMLEILPTFSPDLILMDLYMPDCNGFEATKVIRQTSSYTNIPIVYLSSEKDLGEQLNAMQIGGDDFLQKPIKDEHLVKAISLRAKRFREISALMNKDSLTGLLNNINLKLALEREVALSIRNKKPLSFVMLDIDFFKLVNDNYGHPEGDKVIKTLARLLEHRLRKGDISARYGGEEFAIILPDTNESEAKKVVDSLRARFSQMKFHFNTKKYSVTFSAGVSSFPIFENSQDLISSADQALYQSKNNGRNRVTIYKNEKPQP